MCTDAEWQQEDKKCKSMAVWRRQGSRNRVTNGKKRWRRCKCEDVTQTLLHTDALTHKRSYPETFYTQTPLHIFSHTRFYTQTPLHTNTIYTHTNTVLRIRFRTDAVRMHACMHACMYVHGISPLLYGMQWNDEIWFLGCCKPSDSCPHLQEISLHCPPVPPLLSSHPRRSAASELSFDTSHGDGWWVAFRCRFGATNGGPFAQEYI